MKLTIETTEQRIGQQIFNFLEWLYLYKDISTNQCGRIADTFHISDKELVKYWKEYNK